MTLMLDAVSFEDAIWDPVDFPSLTYLSLFEVKGLKPYINAPSLVTYHEGRCTAIESFSSPLSSLVEYGMYWPDSGDSDPGRLYRSFPNISRISIRANASVLISLLDTLSGHFGSLPLLKTISAGRGTARDVTFTVGEQKTMESTVGIRSRACHMDVVLLFEKRPSFQIPLFFGEVSRHPTK